MDSAHNAKDRGYRLYTLQRNRWPEIWTFLRSIQDSLLVCYGQAPVIDNNDFPKILDLH